MIGDIVLTSELDYKKAKHVVYKLKDNIILIGGGSGTKKSELAHAIQHILWQKNKSSFCISLDDYYYIMPSVRQYNRKKQGIGCVGIKEIDWEDLYRIYEDYENKKEIHFRRTHKYYDAIEHNVLESDFDYLIFEGIYANYIKKSYANNLSVFLEGSPAQTEKFRKLRKKENPNDTFRKQIVQKEFNVACQLKRYADLIIPFNEED